MGEVAAWAAVQPWSNGLVGTFGVSYEGNTAELAAVPNQAAIRAVMPLYDTFDNTEDEGERESRLSRSCASGAMLSPPSTAMTYAAGWK